jgi:hypothetical protein
MGGHRSPRNNPAHDAAMRGFMSGWRVGAT